MKSKIIICLSILAVILGGAHASLHKHHVEPAQKELIQTTVTTEAKTEAESEAECDPECLYKFPYLDGDCEAEGEQPPVTVEEGEIFVLETEGCYTFEESDGHGEGEIFVEEASGCYEFQLEVESSDGDLIHIIEECFDEHEHPKPPVSSDESCDIDVTSHIYRYPFVHPGNDCEIVGGESTETVIFVNEDVINGEVIVTVDDSGETTTITIDENGEVIILPPEETSDTDSGEGHLPTGEEGGETWNPPPPEETTDTDSGEGHLPTGEEGGETWNPPSSDETTDTDSGEGHLPTGEEGGETWNPPPPEETTDTDSGEGHLPTGEEGGETWNPPPPEETSETDGDEGEEFFPPWTVTSDEEEAFEMQFEACYTFEYPSDSDGEGEVIVVVDEYVEELPPTEEVIIDEGSGSVPDEECIIGDTYESGTTIIYNQPTTYITWNRWDVHNHYHVAYTYVLTNIYSGIFKTDEYHYVIYGAGAINFYNTYYGIDAHVHDTPSCSCTCGYQTYTFTYQFGL